MSNFYHKPIHIFDLSFSLPHKLCFERFTQTVYCGQRIAIIGQNGVGKTTLLHMLQGCVAPTFGEILIPADARVGFVPQIIMDHSYSSGSQCFHNKLTAVLALDPNILLLDEPTNHLDQKNRKAFIRMLQSYKGTLIIASHDEELMRLVVDNIWHIDQGKVRVFQGCYDDYKHELLKTNRSIELELASFAKQKKEIHRSLMKEQARAKQSKISGKKNMLRRKWPNLLAGAKAHFASVTAGNKARDLYEQRTNLRERLADFYQPEIVKPNFLIQTGDRGKVLINITDGCIGFGSGNIIQDISLTLLYGERIAITGKNGSGKTTLLRAILGDSSLITTGLWHILPKKYIGYFDQRYTMLDHEKTVFNVLQETQPNWTDREVRKHLNNFLFRKNEEINTTVAHLSGGEKARLMLSNITAKMPKLLILDEITNNLDAETKKHVSETLQEYPGSMIVVSHDAAFLSTINITTTYGIQANINKQESNLLVRL